MQIDVENVQTDVPFHVFVDWIGNLSYSTDENFQGTLALALISENNEIKEIIHREEVLVSPGFGLGHPFNVKVTTGISDTDIIRFITLEKGDDTWLPVTSKECKYTYCKARGNEIVRSKINVTVIGGNDIPYHGFYSGIDGSPILYNPVYSSGYQLNISWPEGKNHHFVKVKPNLDRIQLEENHIYFQIIEKPEYNITLMACSDDELITEQRHYTTMTAGSLGEQLQKSEDFIYINNISVSGQINDADIAFMRDEMPMLEHIDLSEASIVGGILPDYAFEHKGIKSIILPKDLRGFGFNSLSSNKLTKLDIPETVEYYGLNALNGNENLTLVVLRNPKVINVSWCVLFGTGRESGGLFVPVGTRDAFAADNEWGKFGVIVEGSNTEDWVDSNDGIFSYRGVYPNVILSKVISLKDIMVVPETVELAGKTFNVTALAPHVFETLTINEIHLPKSVISIGEAAVSASNLSSIEVDKDNPVFFSDGGVLYNRATSTLIEYPVFKKETEYTVPEGIKVIGGWSVYNMNLHKIILPSTLQTIDDCAFCNSIFRYLENPIIVSKAKTPPYLSTSAFATETYNNASVYVPANSLDAYKGDIKWRYFSNIYPIDQSGIEAIDSDDDIYIIGNTLNTDKSIEIYDVYGKLVFKGVPGSKVLPNGIYIIRVNNKIRKIKI